MLMLAALAGVVVLGVACAWLSPIRYVALGDSLAAGVGSLLLFGYVQRFRLLAARRLRCPIHLTNLGRFGWASGDLLQALRTSTSFRKAVGRAQILTVNIGGNDLRACEEDDACLERVLAEYQHNWSAIWAELRALNPGATALVLTQYNPYPENHPRREDAGHWISTLNAVMADPAVVRQYRIDGIGDGYTPFQGRECRYTWMCLLGDLHPTDLGHAALAGAVDSVFAPVAMRPRGPARWIGYVAYPFWALGHRWPAPDRAE